jgi:hypothetical protein
MPTKNKKRNKRNAAARSSLARGSASSVKGWLAFNFSNPWHYTFSRTRKECWEEVLKNLINPETDRAHFTVRKVVATSLG